ncbi:hypothetical protein [Clostridium sp.]
MGIGSVDGVVEVGEAFHFDTKLKEFRIREATYIAHVRYLQY